MVVPAEGRTVAAFISHRGSDSPQAERLARALRDKGFDVWLDLDEIKPGDSIIARMNEGLERASHLLLLYSDDATEGAWMDREWLSFLARQLNGADVKVIPVRIGRSLGPALLADVKYVDLVTNWSAGVRALEDVLS